MGYTGVAVRCVALTVFACGVAGCAQEEAAPVANATAGFCVGIDQDHAANTRTTVTFMRGGQTLGTVGNVVTGPVAIRVTPGKVQVLVDGKDMATLTLSPGVRVYSTSGTGCPATLSP